MGAANRLVQCRDQVVEDVSAFVPPANHAADGGFQLHGRQLTQTGVSDSGTLIGVEQAAPVAIGKRNQLLSGRFVQHRALGQLSGACQQPAQISVVQRLQHKHRGARQQGRVDFERRVLGGGANEAEQPGLDVRQKSVLLRLVEAVHLVDKQHRGAASAAQRLRLLNRFTDFLHAREHGRQDDEVGLRCAGQQPRQRGLAHARRAPQDHRRQPTRIKGHPQGPARGQQVALAHHFVQGLRPQAFGQRHCRCRGRRRQVEQCVLAGHLAIVSAHPDPACSSPPTGTFRPGHPISPLRAAQSRRRRLAA